MDKDPRWQRAKAILEIVYRLVAMIYLFVRLLQVV